MCSSQLQKEASHPSLTHLRTRTLHALTILFSALCRKQVSSSRVDAERDNVVVPLTLEDYCIKTRARPDAEPVDITDFYDDDYLDDDDDASSDGGTASRRASHSGQRRRAEPRPPPPPDADGAGPSGAPAETPERASSAPDTILRPPQSWPPS